MIKVLIADYDGTLVESLLVHNRMWRDAGRSIGLNFSTEDVMALAGMKYSKIAKTLAGKKWKILLRTHLKNIGKPSFAKKFKEVANLRNFLSSIRKRGIKTAIATANPRKWFHIWIKATGLKKYFDYIVTADDVKNARPHPEMLLKILKHFKIRNSEALYAGDTELDVQMAKRAKVKSVAVLTGKMDLKAAKKAKPDLILKKLTDLRL